MRLTRFDEAREFQRRVTPFLLEHEVENSLPIRLIDRVVRASEEPDSARRPLLFLAEDDSGPIATAVATPPRALVLSRTSPDASEFLAARLAELGHALTGVNALKGVAKVFADAWSRHTGQASTLKMPLRIYRLDRVNSPHGVPGYLRTATLADLDLLTAWARSFYEDAIGEKVDESALAGFRKRVENGEIALWWDAEPVAMAVVAGNSPNSASVGMVYTPPQKRRRGYGSAVTAALSQRALDTGKRFCVLYTDLTNPTSNHIYQQIGYYPVCDCAEYRFE